MTSYVHQKQHNRSRATATRRTTARHAPVHDSPRSRHDAHMQERINNSPRMVAQRTQRDRVFGMPVQRQGMLEEETLPRQAARGTPAPFQRRPDRQDHRTGLPDHLQAGVERLSGMSMRAVHVHYHSSKPSQVQALAYTQGSDIYVGPGQERHLPHEAWHVVQQMQGRVQPTMQVQGTAVNDDPGLEKEAEAMGVRAARLHHAR